MHVMDVGGPKKDPPILTGLSVQVPLSPSAFLIFRTIRTRASHVSVLHDEVQTVLETCNNCLFLRCHHGYRYLIEH
jgi:hypothetical protein